MVTGVQTCALPIYRMIRGAAIAGKILPIVMDCNAGDQNTRCKFDKFFGKGKSDYNIS
jgi:hypothetical protein